MSRIPRGLRIARAKLPEDNVSSSDVTKLVTDNLEKLRELTNEGSGDHEVGAPIAVKSGKLVLGDWKVSGEKGIYFSEEQLKGLAGTFHTHPEDSTHPFPSPQDIMSAAKNDQDVAIIGFPAGEGSPAFLVAYLYPWKREPWKTIRELSQNAKTAGRVSSAIVYIEANAYPVIEVDAQVAMWEL